MNRELSERPYPGLRPFQPNESDIFFGREEQTDQLLEQLGETRFIAVVGLSGCGKSSLVRAGMMAALQSGYLAEAGTQWRVVAMRPGQQPFANLAQALLREEVLTPELRSLFGQEPADLAPVVRDTLQSGAFSLTEIARRSQLPEQTNLLILVDQFEEIFRIQGEQADAESDAFVKLLLTSAKQPEVPIYIVLTMRSDFIGHCARFAGLPEVINQGQFLVPRLTPEQQRIAIEGPAGVFGGRIEPRLVDLLIEQMGNDPDQLPVLQHCLMRMWFQAANRLNVTPEQTNEITLTLADYETVGGLANALSQHAEEAFSELNQKQQGIAEKLFRCLSECGPNYLDMRRSATVHEVADVAGVLAVEVQEVVEVFRHPERCFLTPPQLVQLRPETVLEISHETLIGRWNRLSEWAKQEIESGKNYMELKRILERRLKREPTGGLLGEPERTNFVNWWDKEKPTAKWAERYPSFETLVFTQNTKQKSTTKRDEDHGPSFTQIKNFIANNRANIGLNKKIPEGIQIHQPKGVKYFVFTPTSGLYKPYEGWVTLFGKNGYWWFNLPSALQQKLKDYSNSGKEIKQLAITPNLGWIILEGKNGYETHKISNQIIHILYEINRTGKEIKQVTFTSDSSWVILSESYGYYSMNLPRNFVNNLNQYYNEGKSVKHVAFAPKRGWVILYNYNDFCYYNIPQGLLNQLKQYQKDNAIIKVVAISPSGNWIVIAE